jgi:exonuclease SbcD
MRFLHTADIHLGHQQYGSQVRFNDFSLVFFHIIDQAVLRQVDFVLLAGDLFEKRAVDPLAMRVAVEGLHKLRDAGIPVLAVEGNHEKAYYRDQFSWTDFLDVLGYFRLLNPRFEDGQAVLEPCNGSGGAYADVTDARVYGIKYYGASTSKVFRLFGEALSESGADDNGFTVLMAHAGLALSPPTIWRRSRSSLTTWPWATSTSPTRWTAGSITPAHRRRAA